MRVGIYNRWAWVAGGAGAEKHSLAIAERLAGRADVELLTAEPVDLAALAERLRLRLDAIRVRRLAPGEGSAERASADYDVFLNATYLSLEPSRARRSALLVYFPRPIFADRRTLLKARVAEALARQLAVPRFAGGFTPPVAADCGFARWTDGRGWLRVRLPAGTPHLELALRSAKPCTPVLVSCEAGGERSAHEVVVGPELASYTIPLPPGLAGETTVELSGHVCVRDLRVPGMRHALYRLLFERLFAAQRYVFENPDSRYTALEALGTYGLVCANSRFTQNWVRRYWARDAELLYPPVDTATLSPGPKEPYILSVGRFLAGHNDKRQDVMVEAMRRLHADLPAGWRLVLAGAVGNGSGERRRFEEIRRAAAGLPVDVLADVPSAMLVDLYRRATLYWHAAGFTESRRPDPRTLEHFGIATAEAMAVGCVPLVHGSGGQLELVRPGVDGYTWRTVAELVALTQRLVRDEPLRRRLTEAATASASRFSRESFDARVDRLFGPWLEVEAPTRSSRVAG